MADSLRSAQIVVPCPDLDPTLAFLTGVLGMRIEAIFPADDPTVAVVTGLGVRLRLDAGADGVPPRLRLLSDDVAATVAAALAAGAHAHAGAGATERAGGEVTGAAAASNPASADSPDTAGNATGSVSVEVVAPNGMVIEIVPAEPAIEVPPVTPTLVVDHLAAGAGWHAGRAGMMYRDLDPGRQGGRFIASHIAIPDGGILQDYVHFHRVRFQMIFVRRGWVRLVYEGQGEPFVMHQGDCVLQPPQIRHRVLEASPGFEVIEVGCPAEHETFADLEMTLPSVPLPPDHSWSGQRYVLHVAAEASWSPWRAPGFEHRDTGIGAATDGLAGVRVARATGGVTDTGPLTHDGELWMGHLLEGSATFIVDDREPEALSSGDTVMVPAGSVFSFTGCSPDLELLEVALPA